MWYNYNVEIKTLKKTELFWDCNIDSIDPIENKEFIIERILSRGSMDDFNWAIQFYDIDTIKKVVLRNKTLDIKSQNLWCRYFNINNNLCTRKQSTQRQSPFLTR